MYCVSVIVFSKQGRRYEESYWGDLRYEVQERQSSDVKRDDGYSRSAMCDEGEKAQHIGGFPLIAVAPHGPCTSCQPEESS